MKQVITEYGMFLLEGIVLLSIVILLFSGMQDEDGKVGFFTMAGAELEIETNDYKHYVDFRDTYQTECNKGKPTIAYFGGKLYSGIHKLTDYVKAVDYAGNEIPIEVLSVKNPYDVELIDTFNVTTSEIRFDEAGVYTITVGATDDDNRSAKYVIRIPVNLSRENI